MNFVLSLLPVSGAARPARRTLRLAVLGVVASAGFAVGAAAPELRAADPALNLAFTPGILFDVP